MTPLRLLVWLVVLMALIAPPGMAIHAMAPAGQGASVECADHAPPPDPCPAEGTAKHAAGACCPSMSGVIALLPSPASPDKPFANHVPAPSCVRSLAGRVFSQDPPPPRD